jgi:hypothetical protein
MTATDEPDERRLAPRFPRRPADEPVAEASDDDQGSSDDDELDAVTRLLGFLRDGD